MELNRKVFALLSAGALIGTSAVIALQTHAQHPVAQPAVQVQAQAAQSPATTAVTNSDKVTAQDTDNIQDPGGVEKADSPDSNTEVSDVNDNQAGDTDTTPDNGQGDLGETNDAPAAATK